jgi:hypothetical protein
VFPWIGGYRYEEEMDELSDGTKISRLVKVWNEVSYTAVDDKETVDDDDAAIETDKDSQL